MEGSFPSCGRRYLSKVCRHDRSVVGLRRTATCSAMYCSASSAIVGPLRTPFSAPGRAGVSSFFRRAMRLCCKRGEWTRVVRRSRVRIQVTVVRRPDGAGTPRDMHGSKDVVHLVEKTPCAIGYSGLAYATDHVKMACIASADGAHCVNPSVATASDGSYPAASPSPPFETLYRDLTVRLDELMQILVPLILPVVVILRTLIFKGGPVISIDFLFTFPVDGMTAGGIFPALLGTVGQGCDPPWTHRDGRSPRITPCSARRPAPTTHGRPRRLHVRTRRFHHTRPNARSRARLGAHAAHGGRTRSSHRRLHHRHPLTERFRLRSGG